MITQKCLTVGALAATAFIALAAPLAEAEPLTPLTPNQIQFLEQARRVFSVNHDPTAFRSDGELLVYGQRACDKRAKDMVGYEATLVSPALTQLAFIYLCPQ